MNLSTAFFARLLVGLCLACAVSLIDVKPGQAQPSFEQIHIKDDLKPNNITFSGTLGGRLDTRRLVAGLHLFKEGANLRFDTLQLKTGPIWLPSIEAMSQELRICAKILSLNGLYSAEVLHRIDFETDQKLVLGHDLLKYVVKTDYAKDLKAGYYGEDMLARLFISNDCLSQNSNLYLPLSVVADPDSLLVVFEIGDVTVSSTLHSYDRDTKLKTTEGEPLTCVPTVRVDAGFDCTLNYRAKNIPAGVYELVTVFRRPGLEDYKKSIVFALPE